MNNEVVKEERKRAINKIAKLVTKDRLKLEYSSKTVPTSLEIRNLAVGFVKSRDLFEDGSFDEVLASALPDLHYSYIVNKCSTEEFGTIMKYHESKLDILDYEELTPGAVAFAVSEFRRFVGFSNLIMPGRYLFDFCMIISNSPQVLCNYVTLKSLELFKGEEIDLGNKLLNEVQKILKEYITNPVNLIESVTYELVKEVNEDGADVYVRMGDGLAIKKEIVNNEERYYMGIDNYKYLNSTNFETLGKIKNIYKSKGLLL